MKNLILVVLIALVANTVVAQSKIQFKTLTHDFGQVKEANGSVSYEFEFTNTGTAPLIIQNVEASCGCTTPSWPKIPVAPGKKGVIKASYDPNNRPGAFTKTINVTSNAQTAKVTLTINGEVIGKTIVNNDKTYPVVLGNIRMKSDMVNFGKVKKEESKEIYFDVFNGSSQKVTITISGLPDYIKVEEASITLMAGEKTMVTFLLDGSKIKDKGNKTGNFSVKTSENKTISLKFSAIVE